jgi:hypothetical protein
MPNSASLPRMCETARKRVADGLTVLAENLLAHLDFEEREAGPTLRRLERL